jgi:TDG/mug DNA glycosylase family protein
VPERLQPADEHRVLEFGVGLTDLVRTEPSPPGEPPRFDVAGFHRLVRRCRPDALAFVSKSAAASYARAAGERAPRGYGPLSWDVAGVPAFVLPGPSGANNGMPLPLRIALWSDLADFLETL